MLGRSKNVRKRRECKSKVWKLLLIYNFKSLIQPCLTVLCIAGFFPYKNKSSKYVFSWMRFVWSMLVMIIYTFCQMFSLYGIHFNQTYAEISIQLRSNIFMVTSYLIFSVNYFSSRSKVRMLEKLSDVSRTLSPQFFRKLAKRIFIKDLVTIAFLSVYLPVLFVFPEMFTYIAFYTLFVTVMLHVLYMDSVYVLGVCLQRINVSLMNLRKTLITDEPHLLRRVYHMKNNHILIMEVKILREQYLHIGEAVQLLNDAFGSAAISMLACAILYVTFIIYDYVHLGLNNTSFNAWYMVDLGLTICYSGNLVRMILTCESARDQAKKIGSSIHQNLVTTFDEQLSAELESFSVQVLQQRISFSVMGLAIDATLLAKVVSVITTHLLILIQFLILKPC